MCFIVEALLRNYADTIPEVVILAANFANRIESVWPIFVRDKKVDYPSRFALGTSLHSETIGSSLVPNSAMFLVALRDRGGTTAGSRPVNF